MYSMRGGGEAFGRREQEIPFTMRRPIPRVSKYSSRSPRNCALHSPTLPGTPSFADSLDAPHILRHLLLFYCTTFHIRPGYLPIALGCLALLFVVGGLCREN